MDWATWPTVSDPAATPGSPDEELPARPQTPDVEDFPPAKKKPRLDDSPPDGDSRQEGDPGSPSQEEERRTAEAQSASQSLNMHSQETKDSDISSPRGLPSSPLHVSSQESMITLPSSSQASQELPELTTDSQPKPEGQTKPEDQSEPSSSSQTTGEAGPEKTKRQLDEEQRVKMQLLVAAFSEDQLDRYEMYRRSSFPKSVIKRFMQSVTGGSISQNVVIAMSGVSKVYVGEIVEKGLDVMRQWGDTGPLRPKHIREAARRLKQENKVPLTRVKSTMFR